MRADAAPELGYLRAESGVRIFPDGMAGRSAGHFGIEVAAGVQALDFRESCGFGPCPSRDWRAGPTVTLGLVGRFR